jgi:hypothetical protein
MFKRALLALLLATTSAYSQAVYPGGGGGYNTFCYTQAPGTNNNTCASTAFVQALAAGGGIDASTLLTKTWAVPGTIGSTTPSTGAFTTLAASSTVSGAGFSAYLASPPAIGGTVAAAGTFTTLSGTTSVTGGTGSFTTLAASNATTLAAGTTSIAPLIFQSGTNLTTAAAGRMEYDGTVFYSSPQASNRGVTTSEYFVVLTSSNALTNGTSAQPAFDGGGGPANGRITLPTGTYFFEEYWDVGSLSASAHTISTSWGGTATIGTIKFNGTASDSAATIVSGQAATAVQVGAAGVTGTQTLRALWSGVFTVTVAGTIIPQITQGTNAAAANMLIGSYLRIHPVGTSTVTTVGNWD